MEREASDEVQKSLHAQPGPNEVSCKHNNEMCIDLHSATPALLSIG